MLERVLEPEVMDDPSEAAAYHAMNHEKVNELFVGDLKKSLPPSGIRGPILDLGAGNGLIPVLLHSVFPHSPVVALDAAKSMLVIAKKVAGDAGLSEVGLVQARAQRLPHPDGAFPLVVSNSLIHHLPDPWPALSEIWRVLAPGGWVFLRDLFRPVSQSLINQLVDTYARGESETARRLLGESLHAALTVAEMRKLVERLGVDGETVFASSDRHWTWCCQKTVAYVA